MADRRELDGEVIHRDRVGSEIEIRVPPRPARLLKNQCFVNICSTGQDLRGNCTYIDYSDFAALQPPRLLHDTQVPADPVHPFLLNTAFRRTKISRSDFA